MFIKGHDSDHPLDLRDDGRELLNLNIQVHLLFDVGIAGRQHLDLSIGQCGFVNLLAGSHRRFAGHYLRSELLLAFHELIQVGIQSFFRHETVDVNLCIFVALPDTSAEPLFQGRGSPRAVEDVYKRQGEGNEVVFPPISARHLFKRRIGKQVNGTLKEMHRAAVAVCGQKKIYIFVV